MDTPQPEKKDHPLQDTAISVAIMLSDAITNGRLAPFAVDSDIIEKIHEAMLPIFQENSPLVFSESENQLLVCDRPVEKQGQESLEVKAFTDTLKGFGIRRLTFEKGIERQEIQMLIDMFSSTPEDFETREEVMAIVDDEHMPHIIFETADPPASLAETEKEEISTPPPSVNQDAVVSLVQILDQILDSYRKDLVSKQIAESIAVRDENDRILVLTQKTDTEFGIAMFNHLLNSLDEETFEQTVKTLQKTIAKRENLQEQTDTENSKTAFPVELDQLKTAYDAIKNSKKGRQIQLQIHSREELEKTELERNQLRRKEGIQQILLGHDEPFSDEVVMSAIPEMIDHLYNQKKEPMAEKLILRISRGLKSHGEKAKSLAAEVLVKILETLLNEGRIETVKSTAFNLIPLFVNETHPPSHLKKIFTQLQQVSTTLIRDNQFSETLPILSFFMTTCRGNGDTNMDVKMWTEFALAETASDDIIDFLVQQLCTRDRDIRDGASSVLAHFGKYCVNHLLDILYASDDRTERIRVLKVINELGKEALPLIVERIQEDNPWYFNRNLVILLGRVGTEEDAKFLKPFFSHEDLRIQGEVITSLLAIGGKYRGPMLVSALEAVDDSIKPNVVTLLGALEYAPAVKPLLEILENRPEIVTENRIELEEKICLTLGRIGDPDIIPILEPMTDPTSGALEIGSVPQKVQVAAALAISMIKEKPSRQKSAAAHSETPKADRPSSFQQTDFDTLSAALDSHIPVPHKEFVSDPEISKSQKFDMPDTSYRSPKSVKQGTAQSSAAPRIRANPRLKSSFKIEKNARHKPAPSSIKPEVAAPEHGPHPTSHNRSGLGKRKPSIRSDWKTTIPAMPPAEKQKGTAPPEKVSQKGLSNNVTVIPGTPQNKEPRPGRRKPPEPTIGLKTKIPAGGLSPPPKPKKNP